MKYRLSTILLIVTVVAISLGWYKDHINRKQEFSEVLRRKAVGVWYYPTPDIAQVGYRTTLEIRSDGTFTKSQTYRTSESTFDGTYLHNDDGTVTFHVAERTDDGPMKGMVPNYKPTTIKFDHDFRCRCGIDRTGYLLIEDYGTALFAKETEIQWETYMPNTAR